MERIKQALDRARAEQTLPENAARQGAAAEAPPATLSDPGIAYSQTRVVKLDAAVLKENRIVASDVDRIGMTAYKMLRTQILQRMTARGWNALAVTSPAPEDGKTVTAVNLAISLARELHHTVLLVDMDLRNPSVHRCLGIRPDKGIADYLLHGTPMNEVLFNPGIERLVVLPGREPVENSSEILASPVMGQLVHDLKSRYPARMVVFDLPPILASDDALSFAPHVDAFLLVVREAKTTGTEIQHALELLRDTPIVGTVLNASDEKISPYY